MSTAPTAIVHRMALPDHICPFGVRAKQMLEQAGFEVEDHVMVTRMEVDAFKAEHGIRATPLMFIDQQKIGGCDELERYLASTAAA